jgi:CRISPR system Cascade subunit CasA
VIARGIVRGKGKTEGYHERRVPISGRLRRFLGPDGATDEVAKIASERVENVGTFGGKVLFSTAMTIYTAAPSGGERSRDDDATAKARAQVVVNSFEHEVDTRFFSDLTVEIDVLGDSAAMRNVRSAWIAVLHDIGRHVIETTLDSAPGAAMRRYRIAARARRRFDTAFRSYFAEWIPDHTAQADVVAVQSDTPDLEVSSDDDN